MPGDRVLSVDGREMRTWDQFFIEIGSRARPRHRVRLRSRRAARNGSRDAGAAEKYEVGEIGVLPKTRMQIGEVTPGMPAEQSGFRRGDVILAVDGKPEPEYQPASSPTSSPNPNKPLRFSILRDGTPMEITVTPEGERGHRR